MDTPKTGKNRVHIDINASVGNSIPLEERKMQVNSTVGYLIEIGRQNKTFGMIHVNMGNLCSIRKEMNSAFNKIPNWPKLLAK